MWAPGPLPSGRQCHPPPARRANGCPARIRSGWSVIEATQCLADVGGLASHVKPFVLGTAGRLEATAKQRVVIDHQQSRGYHVVVAISAWGPAHLGGQPTDTGWAGSVSVTVVPWPFLDSMLTRAPMRAARSRMILVPTWVSQAAHRSKPQPLSRTTKLPLRAFFTSRLTPAGIRHVCAHWTRPPAPHAEPAPAHRPAAAAPGPRCANSRRQAGLVLNFCSVSCNACSMSSVLVRVRKCTSSSRTSLMLSRSPASSSSSAVCTFAGLRRSAAAQQLHLDFQKRQRLCDGVVQLARQQARSSPTAASRSRAAARRPFQRTGQVAGQGIQQLRLLRG
jgi:hypothetical protein